MIIRSVTLDYFRNYLHLEADFDPGVNVIYGDNAQGKTNLLEALSYFAWCGSFRTRYDREIISFATDHAFIKEELSTRGRDFTLEAQLSRGRRHEITVNGVRAETAADLAGTLRCVLFSPDDLYLIKASPADRRRFLDSAISQLRPKYAAALREYQKLHQQKTRILKDWREKPSLLEPLEDFSLRMAQVGAILVHYRAYYVKRLSELAPAVHTAVSGGKETLSLSYRTVSTIRDPLAPVKELFGEILEHQEAHREAEIAAGSCLTGPHKDDLEISINDRPAKTFASQGQIRTAALSLKLAEREILQNDCGEFPVLLLDDVLSELDPQRQEFVLNRIGGGQVFITCCEESSVAGLRSGKTFRIRQGRLV